MNDRLRIALIDDDEAVLDSLRLYLTDQGIDPRCYASAEAFLAERDEIEPPSCVVTDVRMPGLGGMELVRRLTAEANPLPIVVITGHGRIEMAVAAIKLGAADFIEKPFEEARLLSAILGATTAATRRQADAKLRVDLRGRYDFLTERQKQVMQLAAKGHSNKEIGHLLDISPKTVEIHRALMMSRMGARNIAELVRIEMELNSRS